MEKASLLLLVAFYTSPVLSQSSTAGEFCCSTQVVTGRGDLDGTYELLESKNEKPEDICLDGCIYTKVSGSPEDKYCFKSAVGSGESKCQEPIPDNPEEITSEKASLENDIENDEKEIEQRTAEEEDTTELDDALDGVTEKMNE